MKSVDRLVEISNKLSTEVVRTRKVITMVNAINILTIVVLIIFMVTQ